MINKNLKGTQHKLMYYRYRPTGTETPKVRKVDGVEQIYTEKELEKIYITEDNVRKFSLDKHGQPIPYVDGHVTILSNYIFDYWSHFLGAEGVALYAHLKRYCYGDKDYCWPDLKLISLKMNKSRNTIKKFLGTLERYGFVLVFNVQNADMNNMEESPLYKVRKQVPFLPQELYEQLPTELKLDHDKYMQGIVANFDQFLNLNPAVDYLEIYDDVVKHGTVVRKEKSVLQLEKEALNKISLLEQERTDEDTKLWDQVLSGISTTLSRPSFDTWFKNTFAIKRGQVLTVYSPVPFTRDWLRERYKDTILQIVLPFACDISEIHFDCVQLD
ncbi:MULTISPECIES: DnaA N-terminal domain-containing protein [unclassified Paenibacillus]|uniref:DnaA N-terminal domain-containing protein n=1 Tax=Paenibacillus TaxID=44249 RepID=UPI001960E27C|nr:MULTISPECIES: DnaA N-terminal domain-containing protein [unclassified Paenibacillus]MCM3130559.1 helix-turn-helix domain-containing protein [Paenibacillus sp. MER 78]